MNTTHIIPLEDTMEHETTGACPCHPLLMLNNHWVHNAKDCREKLERQGIPTGRKWITIHPDDGLQLA